MEKKKYSKPVVVAERFEPQEYVAACWYVDGVISRLYNDKTPQNRNYDSWRDEEIYDYSDYAGILEYFYGRQPDDTDYNKNEPPSPEQGAFYTRYTVQGPRYNRTYPYDQNSKLDPVYKVGNFYYRNLHVTGAS